MDWWKIVEPYQKANTMNNDVNGVIVNLIDVGTQQWGAKAKQSRRRHSPIKNRIHEHITVAVLVLPIWFICIDALPIYKRDDIVFDAICSVTMTPERNIWDCSVGSKRKIHYEEIR